MTRPLFLFSTAFILSSFSLAQEHAQAPSPSPVQNNTAQATPQAQKPRVISGTLRPKENTPAIVFIPKAVTDISLTNVLGQGAAVKEGVSIAIADLKPLDQQIEKWEVYVKSCELNLQKQSFEADQLKISSDKQIEAARLALKRAEENLNDFKNKTKLRMIDEENEKVSKAKRYIFYKEDELKQLSKMYSDDQVAVETEEIILTRIKNDLSDAKFALAGAEHHSELGKTRTIPRLSEDYEKAVDNARNNLVNLEGKIKFDLRQKAMDLDAAKKALEDGKNKLDELKSDRELCLFKAPVNGILLFGGYNGGKWDNSAATQKMKRGGKLLPFDVMATIVAADAEMIIEALLPNDLPAPSEGRNVKFTLYGGQPIQGTVTQTATIPGVDGSRRIVITPEAKVFAPGAPVNVILSE